MPQVISWQMIWTARPGAAPTPRECPANGADGKLTAAQSHWTQLEGNWQDAPRLSCRDTSSAWAHSRHSRRGWQVGRPSRSRPHGTLPS